VEIGNIVVEGGFGAQGVLIASRLIVRDSDPGTSSTLSYDTGIPYGEGTYLLTYTRIEDSFSLYVELKVGNIAFFLPQYGVWFEPVEASAVRIDYHVLIDINYDAGYELLYPEYSSELDDAVAEILADENITETRGVPDGIMRYATSYSALPDDESWGGPITFSASPSSQYARFLSVEVT